MLANLGTSRATTRYCPDCACERPLDAFGEHTRRHKDGSARLLRHCKSHTSARVMAKRRERELAPVPKPWPPEKEQYLRVHFGIETDEVIGRAIGKSADAVRLKAKSMRLKRPARKRRVMKIGEVMR